MQTILYLQMKEKLVVFMISNQTKLNKKDLGLNLTIPAVTVFWRESGQPKATTQSPGWSLDDDPSLAAGNGVLDLIFTTAMSEWRSALRTTPSNSRPSCKVTLTCYNIEPFEKETGKHMHVRNNHLDQIIINDLKHRNKSYSARIESAVIIHSDVAFRALSLVLSR